MPEAERAIIIGAGVAGLTAAIALTRAGVDATVFEASPELREIGAGLGIQYGAMKALDKIGLVDEVRELGQPLEQMSWTTWKGKPIATIPHAAIAQRLGTQTVNVNRGEFLNFLVGALGRERIVLSARLKGFDDDAGGVTAEFEDGRTEHGAVLLGADGVKSVVRARALGDGPPRATSMVVWRAMPAFEHPAVPLGMLRQSFGTGKLFSMVPGTKGRIFWFAVGLVSDFGEKPTTPRKDELLGAFGDWGEPIPELLRSTSEQEMSRTRIFDRQPAQRWGTGRVTLAGDAAHPMMPTLGQGASTGIEDGVVLAKHLSQAGGLADPTAVRRALDAYEAERIARTSPLVNNAHRFAPIALASNPLSTRLRDLFLACTPASSWQRRLWAQHSYEP